MKNPYGIRAFFWNFMMFKDKDFRLMGILMWLTVLLYGGALVLILTTL